MNKQEFLNELERSLRGKVDEAELDRQVQYYSSYIKSEMDAGKSEAEVLESLGDPRLIARTIVQTYNMKDDPIRNSYKKSRADWTEGEDAAGEQDTFRSKLKRYIAVAGIVIVLFAALSLVFSVLRMLFPVLVIAVIIMVIIRMVR